MDNSYIELPLREWLELGQAFYDKTVISPTYFNKHSTQRILIGKGCKIKADGKVYGPGEYVCIPSKSD